MHGEARPLHTQEAVADAVLEQPRAVEVAHDAVVLVVVPTWRDQRAQRPRLLVPTGYQRWRRLTQCQVDCAEVYRLLESPFSGREDARVSEPDGRRVQPCRELRQLRTTLVEHATGAQPFTLAACDMLVHAIGRRTVLRELGKAQQAPRDPQPVSEALEQVERGDAPEAALKLAHVGLGNANQHADISLACPCPLAVVANDRPYVTSGEGLHDLRAIPETGGWRWRLVSSGGHGSRFLSRFLDHLG